MKRTITAAIVSAGLVLSGCSRKTSIRFGTAPEGGVYYSFGAELARLVVKESYQNQGIAKNLLQCGMKELAKRGYRSVHFLVSKTNERALRAYEPLGFDNRGEWFGYEHDWWCYEKSL